MYTLSSLLPYADFYDKVCRRKDSDGMVRLIELGEYAPDNTRVWFHTRNGLRAYIVGIRYYDDARTILVSSPDIDGLLRIDGETRVFFTGIEKGEGHDV